MSSLKDLMHGDGRLDTALRAIALAVFVAVAVALVWTTLAIRRDAAAMPPDSVYDVTPPYDLPNPSIEKEPQP